MLRTRVDYDLWTFILTSNSPMVYSWDFRHAVITLIASSSFAWTVKFYTSNMETQPSLWSTASASNEYIATNVVNLDSWSSIAWSTWLTYTGAEDWLSKYEIDENLNKWIWIKVTRTAWTLIAKIDLSSN